MLTLDWLDKSDRTPIKLMLNNRLIYSAHVDGVLVDPMTLRGHILLNVNPDIIRIPHWVVFQSIDDDRCRVAPIYDDLVDHVMKEREIFEQPVDLRAVYDMLSL